MAIFNSYVKLPEGILIWSDFQRCFSDSTWRKTLVGLETVCMLCPLSCRKLWDRPFWFTFIVYLKGLKTTWRWVTPNFSGHGARQRTGPRPRYRFRSGNTYTGQWLGNERPVRLLKHGHFPNGYQIHGDIRAFVVCLCIKSWEHHLKSSPVSNFTKPWCS